jgi:hypothetical protein
MAAKYDKNRVEWIDNGSPKLLALLEADAQKAIAWITEQPLRTLTGQQCREWCATHGWSAGYGQKVIERAGEALKVKTEADAETVRARLLTLIERLIPECIEYKTGTGSSSPHLGSEGTVFLKHPVTGEYLTQIDHAAVKGYIQEIGKLTGVTNETTNHQHLHLVRAIKAGDLSEVPTAVLEQQLARLMPPDEKL